MISNKDYPKKLAAVEAEIAAVQHELSQCADERAQTPLRARLGSLERSASWYKRRIPRQIEVLGVGVSDVINTLEAT